MNERQVYILRNYSLEHILKPPFWKGSDIESVGQQTLYKAARIPILIRPENLPPANLLKAGENNFFYSSVRSRYAQLGIEVDEKVGASIAEAIANNHHMDKDGNPSPFYSEALITNHSVRPIYLQNGAKVFRLYHYEEGSALYGEDLVNFVKSKDIEIEGQFGTDWDFVSAQSVFTGREYVTGIRVRIDTNNRWWIPPHEDNEPVSISDIDPNYRESIDNLFVPIPEKDEKILWIGQTVKINLSSAVEALLDREVSPDIKGTQTLQGWGYQTNSRLIDGGRTNWNVRVEVLSATKSDLMPHFVTFTFQRSLRYRV